MDWNNPDAFGGKVATIPDLIAVLTVWYFTKFQKISNN